MIDANSQFFAILTNVGMAKQANADALGIPWKITEMGVGDANNTDPIPSATQKKLINEWRRRPLNQLRVDPVNPAVLIAEQVIPADEGGHWIREIGLWDADGDLVAVANCAPSFKPVLSQGSGRTQIVRMNFIVRSTGNITLKIDPAVVLATRSYVDTVIIDVLPPNKKPGTFTKVTINERGVVQSGSNPDTLAGYGITDGFATAIAGSDYSGLAKSGLYVFPASSTPNRPEGFSGSGAFHHTINDYAFTLSYDLASDAAAFRRTFPGGYGPWRSLWHSGNFDPANKADKASSLVGYGVAFASQPEAEAGADTNKPMNALRVFQAIAAKVVQATESALGIARIATQTLVNGGIDDTTIVTPKKLRFGVSWLLGVNGYIALPVWLGGFILQWGVANQIGQATTTPGALGPTRDVSFPVAFPVEALRVFVSMDFSSMATTSSFAPGAIIISKSVLRLQNNYTGSTGNMSWWAIGY